MALGQFQAIGFADPLTALHARTGPTRLLELPLPPRRCKLASEAGTMGTATRIEKNGRQFEIRAQVTAGDWQVWVFEDGAKVYLYELVPAEAVADDKERIEGALRRARADIENESITIPVVRR
jgi:hypothetical protein